VALLAVPLSAYAAPGVYKCQGPQQPSGPAQFGSCKGNVPAQLLWGALGGKLFSLVQRPIDPLARHTAEKVAEKGVENLIDKLWDRHTLLLNPLGGLPCSFDPPGENRFVGDKFIFDGLMDFPLPFPISAGVVPASRYLGPTIKEKSVLYGGMEALLSGGNLANYDQLVGSSLVGPTAKVRVAVGGCCLPLPVNKAIVQINGQLHELPKPPHQLATIYEVEVPISEIRFPDPATNGFCPWPALNLILVAHPYINTLMDWAEITISSSPPYVLLPGTQTMNPTNSPVAFACEAAKAVKALAAVSPLITVPIDAAGSLSGGYDLCAYNAKKSWSEMLSVISADGVPVKTTDDMLQIPSILSAEGGFPMPGNMFLPVAPVEYYLAASAKSMGVGSIRVIAHSKGGVDMLQYLTSDLYAGTHKGGGLQVTGVATLSTPFGGSPLAASWLRGKSEPPSELTGLIAEKNLIELTTNLDYVVAQMNNFTTLGYGWPGMFITGEQDPAMARKLTAKAVGRGLKGNRPDFVTFGANADNSGDDQIRMDCSGTLELLGMSLPNCKPINDNVPGGDFPASVLRESQYLLVGYGNCLGFDSSGSCTGGWGGLVHNDTVVDVASASIPNGVARNHYIIDVNAGHGHWGGAEGTGLGGNADHSQIMSERAGDVWPIIKSELSQSPTVNY
jgi:hypothetical protein